MTLFEEKAAEFRSIRKQMKVIQTTIYESKHNAFWMELAKDYEVYLSMKKENPDLRFGFYTFSGKFIDWTPDV